MNHWHENIVIRIPQGTVQSKSWILELGDEISGNAWYPASPGQFQFRASAFASASRALRSVSEPALRSWF